MLVLQGGENKLSLNQTYSKDFFCMYKLQMYPFDSQVFNILTLGLITITGCLKKRPFSGDLNFIHFVDFVHVNLIMYTIKQTHLEVFS